MSSQTWSLIAGAAAITYFLRAAPFVMSRFIKPFSTEVVGLFETMSFAIIGGLVAESLISNDNLAPRILIVILAFALSAWLRKPASLFYVLMIAYYFILQG